MISRIIAFITLLMCSSAFSGTTILFVNGITTSPVGASNNTTAFIYRYCITYKKNCTDGIEIKTAYNRQDGFFDDAGELRIQSQAESKALTDANDNVKNKLPAKHKADYFQYTQGTDEYNLFHAFAKHYLSNIYYEKQMKADGVWNDTNTLGLDPNNANSTVAGVFNKLATQVANELLREGNTRRVMLVPHSQGNYFAQAIKAFYQTKVPNRVNDISVQGVASVSSIAQVNKEHTSITADRALFTHTIESLSNFSRQPNFQAGWKLGATPEKDDFLQAHPDDATNHGFLEVYMGMKLVDLPVDGIRCSKQVIPAEEFVAIRDARRIKYGVTCQKKEEAINGSVLIGVGNMFPDLRGTTLPQHIIDKVAASLPNGKGLVITPLSSFLSKDTVFTVSGNNLIPKMYVDIQDCTPNTENEMPGGTADQRTYRCTFNGLPGTKKGYLKSPVDNSVLLEFNVEIKVGSNTSQWISTVSPPGYILKYLIDGDLLKLPNGETTLLGQSRSNHDLSSCNLMQSNQIKVTKNGTNYKFVMTAIDDRTFCPDVLYTATKGYTETFDGILGLDNVIRLTPNGQTCSFRYKSTCYNFTSISPLP
jgi:hypothetical protein